MVYKSAILKISFCFQLDFLLNCSRLYCFFLSIQTFELGKNLMSNFGLKIWLFWSELHFNPQLVIGVSATLLNLLLKHFSNSAMHFELTQSSLKQRKLHQVVEFLLIVLHHIDIAKYSIWSRFLPKKKILWTRVLNEWNKFKDWNIRQILWLDGYLEQDYCNKTEVSCKCYEQVCLKNKLKEINLSFV